MKVDNIVLSEGGILLIVCLVFACYYKSVNKLIGSNCTEISCCGFSVKRQPLSEEDVYSTERIFAVGSSQDSKLFERRSRPTLDDAVNEGRGHIVNTVELEHPQRAMRARRGDVRIRAVVSIAHDEAP